MRYLRSGSKSKRNTKKRRNLSGSKRNRGLLSGTAKLVKKKVNIPVPEGQTDCCFSKESIMISINDLQSKHKKLISDQLKMKMEIHNLFTDFANSIVDGIETRTTIEHIQDSSDCSLQGMSKKRRTTSEDIQSNDKVGNEINASVPISLLED
ncbi:Uncharacterized protein Fot_09939 [Forsythia ovata]|uniref:Uncharacterized protein n=1 Tax=Forsythia ovata TaxID=205694 RepID=A0ABD1WFE7_9LAMI